MDRSTPKGVPASRLGRVRTRTLLPGLALATTLLSLVLAGPASAGLQHEFSIFATCPYEAHPEIQCVYSTTTSGEFHLGSKTVPIAPKVVILKGGLLKGSEELVAPTDGETLSKTPLQLPGGLAGIELLPPLTEVNAIAEVAGPIDVNVSKEASGVGPAVVMPLQVRLENTLLGPTCTVGSTSEPLVLNLTTGTTSPPGPNSPIKGNPGKLVLKGSGKIGEVAGSSLVDNAFAAPGANGCEGILAPVIDPLVDIVAGLPAAAGTNTAILNGSFQAADGKVVKHVLALPQLGRCQKVPAEKVGKEIQYHGLYTNGGCTFEIPQLMGKFEWTPGTGPGKHFTAEGKVATLETKAKTKISCTESHGSGEYTGPKTASLAGLTLTGCQVLPAKEACQSSGAAAGELKTTALSGELGFVKDEPIVGALIVKLGYALKGSSATIIEGTCGPSNIAIKVNGGVIAPIGSINTNVLAYNLKLTQKAGVQSPESFEEEPNQTLSLLYGAVPSEAVGLQTALKITNEEKLEFKAVSE